eukprot:m.47433 g.47433  ORF g.47433 m.47433 type:complete len:406 (-) comp13221_c0_seq6:57-1274(-)
MQWPLSPTTVKSKQQCKKHLMRAKKVLGKWKSLTKSQKDGKKLLTLDQVRAAVGNCKIAKKLTLLSSNAVGGGLANLKSKITDAAEWSKVGYLQALLTMFEIEAVKTGDLATEMRRGALMQHLGLLLVTKELELPEFLRHARDLTGFHPTKFEVVDLKAALDCIPAVTFKDLSAPSYPMYGRGLLSGKLNLFAHTPGRGCEISLVKPGSTEFQAVLKPMPASEKQMVLRVLKVRNSTLEGCFRSRKNYIASHNQGNPNVKRLYHGTSAGLLNSINHNGFRRDYAGRNGTALGRGVYFTSTLATALGFAARDPYGLGYVYVADVAVGCTSNANTPVPMRDELIMADTRESRGVYVTFRDDQAIMRYIVVFKEPSCADFCLRCRQPYADSVRTLGYCADCGKPEYLK